MTRSVRTCAVVRALESTLGVVPTLVIVCVERLLKILSGTAEAAPSRSSCTDIDTYGQHLPFPAWVYAPPSLRSKAASVTLITSTPEQSKNN